MSLNSTYVAYTLAAEVGDFTLRNRSAVDVLCTKLEKVLIEHRVRTIVGSTLVADTVGGPLLTIQQVERIVIAWLIGDIDAAALRLKTLGAIYDAYKQGRVVPHVDHCGLGRQPLIINNECKALLDLSDARAAYDLEIVCDMRPSATAYEAQSAAAGG